jgi:serine/threonine-protein kinase
VHRDLKPENVFLLRHKAGWADFVKIIDFGVSKFQPLTAAEGMRMTATGVVMGTPCYLSPEQARGSREVDHRSDIYAVGVMLYEAVTGRLPFDAENFNDLLFKIVLETPPAPHEVLPDLDRDFSQIIAKAMTRDPAERFQTATECADALAHWASSRGLVLSGPVVTSSSKTRLPSNHELAVAPSMTPGSWHSTQNSDIARVQFRSRKGLVAALAAGAVLLVGAAGFAIYAAVGDAEDTAASATPAATTPPPAPAAEPDPAQTEPAPAAQPAAPFIPEPPSEVVDAGTARPSEPAPITVQQPRRQVRQQPASTPAPKAAPKKPAATTTAQPAPAKPKRRDFGY